MKTITDSTNNSKDNENFGDDSELHITGTILNCLAVVTTEKNHPTEEKSLGERFPAQTIGSQGHHAVWATGCPSV